MKNAIILVVMIMTLLWLNTKINDKKGEEKSCPVADLVLTAKLPEETKMPKPLLKTIEASFPGNDAIIPSDKKTEPQPGLEYNPVI